jgi:DNA invertase Pin-like site-specific DNA recombinase
LLTAIFAWAAKQERLRISERTRLGLERARKEGKILGRPREITDEQAAAIRE